MLIIFTLRQESGAAGKNKGRVGVVADCLDMNFATFGYIAVFSSSRLAFELFS
jgi:N-methylhydantoinase B/oxoprolinase/acetone carboxylase alpha subunit